MGRRYGAATCRRLNSLVAQLPPPGACDASSTGAQCDSSGGNSGCEHSVPVIDFEAVANASSVQGLSRNLAVVSQIRAACSKWGFFQLVNHGISQQQLHAFETAMKGFFAQPNSIKEAVRRTGAHLGSYLMCNVRAFELHDKLGCF